MEPGTLIAVVALVLSLLGPLVGRLFRKDDARVEKLQGDVESLKRDLDRYKLTAAKNEGLSESLKEILELKFKGLEDNLNTKITAMQIMLEQLTK
jgi:uncharacterized membrane-anchored protein YhcB (DUF1043 family)